MEWQAAPQSLVMRVRIRWHSAAKQPYCPLPFPARPDSRVAQVGDFPILQGLPWFYVEWCEALIKLRPTIVIGHHNALRRLSELVTRQKIDFPVDGALFSLTRVGERPLLDTMREQLWQAFGVPVFEMYVTGNGIILASECEAHNGWHVNPQTACISKLVGEPHVVLNRIGDSGKAFQALGMGFAADVTTDLCECGQATPRVVNLPTCDTQPVAHSLPAGGAARALAAAS
jgi:hypothetical protein